MSLNLNKAIIAGRITKDLELKTTESGKRVISFSVAINRDTEHTTYLDVVAWEKRAEFISKWFKKGSAIFIEGEITNRKYTDSKGNNRIATEILATDVKFVEGKTAENSAPAEEKFIPVENEDSLPF